MCVCVWHSIGSAPGHDTNLRPVSLEPSGPEPAIFKKYFPEKWPVAKLPNKNAMQLMLFYGEIFYIYNFYIFPFISNGPLLEFKKLRFKKKKFLWKVTNGQITSVNVYDLGGHMKA